MDGKRKLGFFAQSGEDIAELLTGEGASGAGDEEPVIIRFSPFFTNPEPGAQGAALFGEDGLHGGEAVLESSDEEGTPGDIDIGELQAEGFGSAEAVIPCHHNEAVVAFGVGSVKGGIQQGPDLGGRKELTFLHDGKSPEI